MRTALATGAGQPRERTVQTYAQWLANHEQSHLRQIERIVNTLRIEQREGLRLGAEGHNLLEERVQGGQYGIYGSATRPRRRCGRRGVGL